MTSLWPNLSSLLLFSSYDSAGIAILIPPEILFSSLTQPVCTTAIQVIELLYYFFPDQVASWQTSNSLLIKIKSILLAYESHEPEPILSLTSSIPTFHLTYLSPSTFFFEVLRCFEQNLLQYFVLVFLSTKQFVPWCPQSHPSPISSYILTSPSRWLSCVYPIQFIATTLPILYIFIFSIVYMVSWIFRHFT